MKIRAVTIALLLMSYVTAVFAVDIVEASDEAKIRETVLESVRLHSEGDYSQGYALLDTKSKDYFESILEWVLYSSKEEVQTMPFVDKIVVLRMRNQIDSKELQTFQAQDLYQHLNEMSNRPSQNTPDIKLDDIEINDHSATVGIKVSGVNSFLDMNLTLEDDNWKIDMLSTIKNANLMIEKLFSNMDVQMSDQLFPDVIESLSNKPFDESSWEPILTKE